MLKYLGPTGKALSGDLEKSRSLLGPARLLAQRCMDRLTAKGGQGQEFMQQVLADGSKLKALVIGGVGAPVAKVWIDTAFGEEEQEFFFVGCGYLETGLLNVNGYATLDPATIYTNSAMQNLYATYGAVGTFGKFDIDPIEGYNSLACSLDNPRINGSQYRLEVLKRGMTAIPPGMQSGRLRAFVQAKYGHPASGLTFALDPYDPWNNDYYRVAVNGIWLGCTSAYSTGLLVVGSRYFLLIIQSGSVSAKEVVFTDCGKRNLASRASVTDRRLSDVLEAYAFAGATWGETIPVNGRLPSGNTYRWGWKFSWSGQSAACITRGSVIQQHIASFSYDEGNNQINVTYQTASHGTQDLVYPYILPWAWSASRGYYTYGNFYNTTLDRTFDVPVECFYGRTETLTTVFVGIEKIDAHEAYDTGEGDKCSRIGTLAFDRCHYDQHVYFRIRARVNDEVVYDAYYAKVISKGSEHSFENGTSYTSASAGGVYSENAACGQSNPCMGWFPTTQNRVGFDRILIETDVPFMSIPRLFLAHPVRDCEAFYVGSRTYVNHPGYTYYTAQPYDTRHAGVVCSIEIQGKCGSWLRLNTPATPDSSGKLSFSWQTQFREAGPDGYDINVYAVLPSETVAVHSSQGYGGDTSEPPGTSSLTLPNCNIEAVASRVIPDLDWSEEVSWGGWGDFFRLAEFGVVTVSNELIATQSAYARDTFATAGFGPPPYVTDATYSGSGSTFVGWA